MAELTGTGLETALPYLAGHSPHQQEMRAAAVMRQVREFRSATCDRIWEFRSATCDRIWEFRSAT